MSPLDPLNEIGYMPPPSNLEDQIQLTPTIFGAPIFSCKTKKDAGDGT